MMRTCSTCHTKKDIEAFEKASWCKDGRRGQCKDCRNAYRNADILPRTRLQQRYIDRHRRAVAKYRKENRQKVEAHRLARDIPLDESCANCDEPAVHRHHPDYSKPLEIISLCIPCHEAVHHKGLLV